MSTPRLIEQKFLDYKTSSGFWLYLMTDCVLFASLFATYAVLHAAIAGGPSASDIFELPMALTETIILLTSSFTCGLALLALRHNNLKQLIVWLGVTYILGVSFLTIELSEFGSLIQAGHSWQQSAFLSAFFTLVGTHGLHITVGLLWLLVIVGVLFKRGITPKVKRQLMLFGLFWHFLDLVWIFIFTVVYLMGVAA
ncbi:MAG: cyoC [Candidatus Saccharibacteria bacterium]|nr:cyoC [Candidatus Saccharibacteria bacterium]